MFIWTLFFLVGTILFGFIAYREKKDAVTYIGKLFFFIFLLCFLLLLVSTALRSGPPPLREPTPIAFSLDVMPLLV